VRIRWFETREEAETAAAMLDGHLLEARYHTYAMYPTVSEKNMKDADGE